jgi:hypothetical protein
LFAQRLQGRANVLIGQRGDVAEELEQTVGSWLEHLSSDPLAAYRGLF